jgi:hypothetical protein
MLALIPDEVKGIALQPFYFLVYVVKYLARPTLMIGGATHSDEQKMKAKKDYHQPQQFKLRLQCRGHNCARNGP